MARRSRLAAGPAARRFETARANQQNQEGQNLTSMPISLFNNRAQTVRKTRPQTNPDLHPQRAEAPSSKGGHAWTQTMYQTDLAMALPGTLRTHYLRPSFSMLQNRAPCSTASSSATWVWGRSSNQ